MKTRITFLFCVLLLSALYIQGCSGLSYEKIYPTLGDGKYDSEFPYKSTSDELTKISETIQRINSTAFYKIYIFDKDSELTLKDLAGKKLEKVAVTEVVADNSAAGTAITIYSENGNVALLTCAHTVTFPDSIIAYKIDDNGQTSNYIESISIKEKQVVYVAGFPQGSEVSVLVKDDHLDVAVLGRKFDSPSTLNLPVFKYPPGKAKEVEWGTFVYLIGYPINYKILTKAIVSNPRRDDNGSFFIDAVVNPGFSGGPVLAIRDGVPNFELIGIVQWVPEDYDNIIYPADLKNKASYNPVVPYNGELFVRRHSSIKYGMARVIPVESILTFLNANKIYLNARGFYIFNNN